MADSYFPPTLDGEAIFGQAVHMQMVLQKSVNQVAEFFGINGIFPLFGGKRGRMILVEGQLTADNIDDLNAAEGTFETFMDGNSHTLIDTRGRQWTGVIFEGDFQPAPEGPRPLIGWTNEDGSSWWALGYKAAFLATQ